MSVQLIALVSLCYVLFLFLVATYAHLQRQRGKSVINNPVVYALSIAVYCTSWTFYGSVGKAATNGFDFILIYLGPSLTAFSWWFLLRKMVRIAKENNLTSIADFISTRYGKSQWLGALVTIIALLGIMPYIALQLRAVSTTFALITGHPDVHLLTEGGPLSFVHPGFVSAVILGIFSIIFGVRRLSSSERHEGLVAAIAMESLVKLSAFLVVGGFVTYGLFDGFGDIFRQMANRFPEQFDHLTTFGEAGETSYANWCTTLALSMGAVMFLPRQFHIMVIENPDEKQIRQAMWLFPVYLFLINLFVVPVAFGGLLLTGNASGADAFVLTLPLGSGRPWIALLAFLGGFSAAAGMVMVESVAVATMVLNHLVMPFIVRQTPKAWFRPFLINIKRGCILLVILLGYLYHVVIGETYMLANTGLISFAAAAQFAPAMLGGLYWRRGNRIGAITGIACGFAIWLYTLLLPSVIRSGWWQSDLLETGPLGIAILKPTELFGLSGFDIWSHSLFWSLLLNVGCYLVFSILLHQDEREQELAHKFVDVFHPAATAVRWETKRLSKPVTIVEFTNLMAKFLGEKQAYSAISDYVGNREIDEKGQVTEFELPKLKRFAERTLAGSVGGAAARTIVESFLSDVGARMESVYDIFSSVRASRDESREALSVRLRASELLSRTLDLQIIMDDLLDLILQEFKMDAALVRLADSRGTLVVRSYRGNVGRSLAQRSMQPEINTYLGDAFLANQPRFVNDTTHVSRTESRQLLQQEGIRSFAHIPIARQGEPPIGILSVYSHSIVGIFTEPFIRLLDSLAGQLAQAVIITQEMAAREQERREKEVAQLENARVVRDMEIAKQIQLSLLPAQLPELPGIAFASHCLPATHVGGDYYDFFLRSGGVDLVIADVSGHSVGAALIMVETRSVLRAQVAGSRSAAATLGRLNELLYDDLTTAELFITMFYARFHASDRRLNYANAGHNPPLVLRGGTDEVIELDAEGLILGVNRQVRFEEQSIVLQPGDLVLFYTDGVTETRSPAGHLYGTERLVACLQRHRTAAPAAIIEALLAELRSFRQDEPMTDDISLVVMQLAAE